MLHIEIYLCYEVSVEVEEQRIHFLFISRLSDQTEEKMCHLTVRPEQRLINFFDRYKCICLKKFWLKFQVCRPNIDIVSAFLSRPNSYESPCISNLSSYLQSQPMSMSSVSSSFIEAQQTSPCSEQIFSSKNEF